MKIAYYSRTGNVEAFVKWYLMDALGDGYEARNIEEWDADEPFILITPSYNMEEIVDEVEEWLNSSLYYLRGVVGSGNRNFGKAFCVSANLIAEDYDVPLLANFELRGNERVAKELATKIKKINEMETI